MTINTLLSWKGASLFFLFGQKWNRWPMSKGSTRFKGFSPWLGSEGRAVCFFLRAAKGKRRLLLPGNIKCVEEEENFIIFQVYKSHSRSLSLSPEQKASPAAHTSLEWVILLAFNFFECRQQTLVRQIYILLPITFYNLSWKLLSNFCIHNHICNLKTLFNNWYGAICFVV